MVMMVQLGSIDGRLYDTLYQSTASPATHTAQQMLLPFTKMQSQLILDVGRQFLTVHLEGEGKRIRKEIHIRVILW